MADRNAWANGITVNASLVVYIEMVGTMSPKTARVEIRWSGAPEGTGY